jgi:hypothetical protein
VALATGTCKGVDLAAQLVHAFTRQGRLYFNVARLRCQHFTAAAKQLLALQLQRFFWLKLYLVAVTHWGMQCGVSAC